MVAHYPVIVRAKRNTPTDKRVACSMALLHTPNQIRCGKAIRVDKVQISAGGVACAQVTGCCCRDWARGFDKGDILRHQAVPILADDNDLADMLAGALLP